METINIKFGGLSNSPSDEMTSDHAIAASLGLVAQGDELIPVADPSVILSNLSENRKMEYIHTTAGNETYIISDTTDVCKLYVTTDGSIADEATPILTIDGLKRITSIGHILLVLDTNGDTHYVLWRNGKYIDLGTELPQLEVRSSLDTTIFDPTQMIASFGGVQDVDGSLYITSSTAEDNLLNPSVCSYLRDGEVTSIPLTGDVKLKVGQKVIGLTEQYRRILRKHGLFTEPFYVRYAYKLYSGDVVASDYTKHTPPVLMVPNSLGKPIPCVSIDSDGSAKLNPVITASTLHYEITTPNLSDWKDLIQSVDVFVTPLIVDYTSDIDGVNALSVMKGHKRKEDGTWSVSELYYPRFMYKDSNDEMKPKWGNLLTDYKGRPTYRYTKQHLEKGDKFIVSYKEFDKVWHAVEVSSDSVKLYYVASGIELSPEIENYVVLEGVSEEGNKFNLPPGVYSIFCFDSHFITPNETFTYDRDVTYLRITGPYTTNILEDSHFQIDIERTSGSYKEDLTEYSNFYKIAEIPVANIKNGEQELVLEKNALLNLETKDELLDTGQGHIQYKAKEIVAYNSRLSAAVTEETVIPFTSITAQNSHRNNTSSTDTIRKAFVEIIENGQTVYVELKDESIYPSDMRYFAYPNRHATKLIVFRYEGHNENTNRDVYTRKYIPLTKHRFLNLAYAFNDFSSIFHLQNNNDNGYYFEEDFPSTEGITYTNKIITSSTNNPFHFPENLACIVPTDKVDTICATTKALSEGQFGQFPLYAFTNDGVWALSVSSEGKYIAQQAATRDVCNNLYSITQSDNALYFTSDRGVIILAGSESLCISDILNDNGDIFDIKALPHWEELTQLCDATEDETCYIPFLDYIKDASLAYDYIHQRLYIYNPTKDYAYLYSLTFKKWTITRNNIASKVNSYPDALVNTKDHKFVNLCKDSSTIQKQFLVTRPIKLSSPNTLKRIRTVIVHGNFAKGHVACALYGSRDMQSWHLIASRQTHEIRNICGTPYKYFRLVVLPNLAKGETLSYATLEYEPIFNNKLR